MPRRPALLVLAGAVALVAASSAGAHPVLVGSSPGDGSRLVATPQAIHLWFSEGISPRFRSVRLLGPNGRLLAGARVAGAGRELVLRPPRLQRGAYGVVWRVVAEADGHTTSGTVVFGVGAAAAPTPRTVTPVAPAEVALRWLRFFATALLVGGLGFVAFVLPSARPWTDPQLIGRTARRVRAAAVAGGSTALVVELGMLVRQAHAVAATTGTAWTSVLDDLLLSSRWGTLWLAGCAILCGLTVLALELPRRRPAGRSVVAAGALAAAALAGVDALRGHAAAAAHDATPVLVEAAHVLAASLWFGGIAALLVGLAPVGATRPVEARALARVLRRPFAPLAGASFAALVLTGLYNAGVQVASVDALLTTLYGRALLVKAALVAICAGLGIANFLALRRRPLAIALAVEAFAGAGVLLAAATLGASAPARGAAFAAPRPVHAATLTTTAADLVLSLTLRPNRPGVNLVAAAVSSSRRPAPAPVATVQVGGSTLRRLSSGTWAGTVTLPSPGDVSLPVRVARAGGGASLRLPLRVEPLDPARPVRYSSRRLSSLLDPVLVGLLSGLAVVLAFAVVLRHGRTLAPVHQPRKGDA